MGSKDKSNFSMFGGLTTCDDRVVVEVASLKNISKFVEACLIFIFLI